ncbi:HEXXH motif domain-containing protein [Paractinoplanes durhamensis]|uniref:HEXXH motif domain-containing protein n=1 Tax=Paractinoplanes durhamensis TaxID=113563 RepID=A0ABQ3YS37_9ACTN|nr:HEXXH motif domain-containing protein [Actinoplanes durhamensis]GIE00340.1 HEXXH motif domain-containing protein [Actinoplanes durhamensis]
MLSANHRIKDSHVDLLCHGYGSADLTDALWRTEFSRRLLLLGAVVDLVTHRPDLLGPLPPPATSIEMLMEIDASDRAMFRELLLHPQVGSWAAYLLRRARGLVTSPSPLWVDAGVLHALAFVGAVRQGRSWATAIPVRDGKVMLPGLGMAVFSDRAAWGVAEAETDGHQVTLHRRGQDLTVAADGRSWSGDGDWWELRRLRVGSDPVMEVTLDDIDLFRDLGDPVEPQRLSMADHERWGSLLSEAWEILCAHHRASAEAMADGVVSLVPLSDNGVGETRSASTGEAFGSVLVSQPVDARALAVALVHESAHIRLGGLLHLLPATSGVQRENLYAPWRDDPRPLAGLIQGIYAFVDISDFWRVQAGLSQSPADEFEYVLSRLQVEQALRAAAGSDGLTRLGERLINGLADRVAGWKLAPTTETAVRAAELVASAHRTGWRLRHLSPAKDTVDRLVVAWSSGKDAPVLDPGYVVVAGQRQWSQGRLALARRWVIRGDVPLTDRLRAMGVDDADANLLHAERAEAAAAFTRRLLDDPDDLDAWSGLGLAVDGPAAAVLREDAALVRAVHRGTRNPAPDPSVLAEWLARASRTATPGSSSAG